MRTFGWRYCGSHYLAVQLSVYLALCLFNFLFSTPTSSFRSHHFLLISPLYFSLYYFLCELLHFIPLYTNYVYRVSKIGIVLVIIKYDYQYFPIPEHTGYLSGLNITLLWFSLYTRDWRIAQH